MMSDYKKMSYHIINKSRGTELGGADLASSFMSRFMGLMFRRDLERGLILKLPKSRSRYGSGIHMFFMKIPLDIIFVDASKRVVDMISIDPWKTYTPRAPARYVVELERGVITSSNTQIGDELDFTCEHV